MSSLLVTKIFAPNIWGWIGDKTQKRLLIVRIGAFLTFCIFLGVTTNPAFNMMLLIMVGFSFFWNAILPQHEVITLDHLDGDMRRYTRIRLWGSVGFIVTSAGLGWLFDSFPIQWLSYILLGIMFSIWLMTQSLYQRPVDHTKSHLSHSFIQQLMRLPVIVFFLLCFLMQLTHGPYHGFFVLYLNQFGYTKFEAGLLIGLAVVAEIIAFIWMYRLTDRFSVKVLGVACFVLASIRWCVTAMYPQYGWVIIISQLAHAATFGVFHSIAIKLVMQYFTPRTAGQGQALYGGVSFGAGGALGIYFSGHMWDSFGSQNTFLLAGGVAAIGALIALWKLGDPAKAIGEQLPQDEVKHD